MIFPEKFIAEYFIGTLIGFALYDFLKFTFKNFVKDSELRGNEPACKDKNSAPKQPTRPGLEIGIKPSVRFP